MRGTLTVRCVLTLVGLALAAAPAGARMTVIYDVSASVEAMIGAQPDGSPGLDVADGIFQQVVGPLPADRKVGALTTGAGSPANPTITGLGGPAIAAAMRAQIDAAGAGMAFVDIGPDYETSGTDGTNLEAALVELRRTPHPAGGTYAERLHMYVNRIGQIGDPATREPFWHAMALSGGVWLEAYQGQTQWPAELWLAWPRALKDGLVARGMDPARLHIIVRGGNQAAVWAQLRTGAACELLANGPGAYRIEDHAGFVREFRAVFGSAPAPAGPSPVACRPAPTLDAVRAGRLATLFATERTGITLPAVALSTRYVRTGRTVALKVRLGPDPLGIAGRLGAVPAAFWTSAQPRLVATGAGVDTFVALPPDGNATLTVAPTRDGPIRLSLALDGAAVRQWIGAPVDIAASLGVERVRVATTLARVVSDPLTWQLAIPAVSTLRAGPPLPRVSVRVARRGAPGRASLVALRLSRPAARLLIEVGVVTRNGRYVGLRRVRVTGRTATVAVRLPAGRPLRARVVIE